MDRIRIIPPADGSWVGTGTRVLTHEGAEIPSIESINLRFAAGEAITATMELIADIDPLEALPLLGPDTLRRSAEAQGFLLIPKDEAEAPELISQTPLDTGVTHWGRKPPSTSFGRGEASGIYAVAMPVDPPTRRALWFWGTGIVLGFAALYAVLSLAGTALAVLTLGEIATTLLGG